MAQAHFAAIEAAGTTDVYSLLHYIRATRDRWRGTFHLDSSVMQSIPDLEANFKKFVAIRRLDRMVYQTSIIGALWREAARWTYNCVRPLQCTLRQWRRGPARAVSAGTHEHPARAARLRGTRETTTHVPRPPARVPRGHIGPTVASSLARRVELASTN